MHEMIAVPKKQRNKVFFREWRKNCGLSQERAADRIGMDRTNLSKIERGEVKYHQTFLEAAAEAYSCEPADLLTRDPSSPIWTVLETVRKLSENQQKQVAGILKGFLESIKDAA